MVPILGNKWCSENYGKNYVLSYWCTTLTCLQMETAGCWIFDIWTFSISWHTNNLLGIILNNNTYCDWINLASSQRLIRKKLITYLSWNALYLWQNVLTLSQSWYLQWIKSYHRLQVFMLRTNCLQGKTEQGRKCLEALAGLGWSIPSPPPKALCRLPARQRGEPRRGSGHH